MNTWKKKFLINMLKTMEELKDDPNREQFCINFDKEYEKLKVVVEGFDKEKIK